MANRIQVAIVKMRAQIKERLALGMTTRAGVEQCRKDLDMDLDEFVRFQEIKNFAFATGTLTLEEAQLVYNLLGETPSVFNKRDAATKAVLTKVFQELLAARVAADALA